MSRLLVESNDFLRSSGNVYPSRKEQEMSSCIQIEERIKKKEGGNVLGPVIPNFS